MMDGSWTAAVMRRIHERVVGSSRTAAISSTSHVWLLGVCYKFDESESSPLAFEHDFSSRILMTYRRGFDSIEGGDSKCFSSDVNWGCMIRSSQMLVAQALLFHRLGRSWRRPLDKSCSLDQECVEILRQFGDSEAAPFSIHNLIEAGKAYNLAAGSWVGPYAMCRSWETLVCKQREAEAAAAQELDDQPLPMAVYIVSGDENGERGGAPVVCVEDAFRHCSESSGGRVDWTPILLLVPLVLGLEELNPRYIPSLRATFTFPQSVGIMGGRPGVSTYIIGVQDENAIYLDPHLVQPVVNLSSNDLDSDATSSYHCNVIRHIPLDTIDPSLAIGFYCRDKDDFDDFCLRASKLADESNGAPLFTVSAETHNLSKPPSQSDDDLGDNGGDQNNEDADGDGSAHEEDDWQLL
ncbi:putative peptidase C54 [Rosa chinensis]|uniref:Cysteine protease n=1 Tax=Rosa chinensis TaxID=74649 RepID=A0A2P6PMT1_ROSCH|nr:cysteine protease ATG4 [Rosa chinensis]PRQ23227.1 putative peptidase C54 [Rosa chinensis]